MSHAHNPIETSAIAPARGVRAALFAALLAAGAGCSAPALVPVPLPRSSTSSGVTLVYERAALSCDDLIPAPVEDALDVYPPVVATQCSFVSEAVVKNAGAAPRRVEIDLKTLGTRDVVMNLGDGDVPVPMTGSSGTRSAVVLGPGETRALTARGVVFPAEDTWQRIMTGVLATRHPVLAWDSGRRPLRFDVAPGVFAGTRAPIALRVEYPDNWQLEVHGAAARKDAPPAAPAAPTSARTRTVEHASPQPSAVSGTFLPDTPSVAGGPLLGLGLARAGGLDEPWATTGAIGVEVGAPDWVIGSLIVDSDFERRLAAALTIELATPYVRLPSFLLPSIGVGAGLPIRLLEPTAAGLRGQATISFPSFGLTAYVDWFPALRLAEPVLLLRASL